MSGSAPYNYSYIFKYIIIGDMGVGKSCLLHQFTEKKCKILFCDFFFPRNRSKGSFYSKKPSRENWTKRAILQSWLTARTRSASCSARGSSRWQTRRSSCRSGTLRGRRGTFSLYLCSLRQTHCLFCFFPEKYLKKLFHSLESAEAQKSPNIRCVQVPSRHPLVLPWRSRRHHGVRHHAAVDVQPPRDVADGRPHAHEPEYGRLR